jgi:hypothetical protein
MRDLQRHADGGRSRHRLGGWHDGDSQGRPAPKVRAEARAGLLQREHGRARGQVALFVTERAVFRVGAEGLELIEIAPGLDAERDVIAQMGFRPTCRAGSASDGSAHLPPGLMGVAADIHAKPRALSIAARRALAASAAA